MVNNQILIKSSMAYGAQILSQLEFKLNVKFGPRQKYIIGWVKLQKLTQTFRSPLP